MKLLLTAFEPFGNEPVNSSLEALKQMPELICGVEVVKVIVPVVFDKAVGVVAEAIGKERPGAVLCLGQTGGRHELAIERVAINLDDARIKDNEGRQPVDVPIIEGGEPAYFSTLPVKAMETKIRQANVPVSLSSFAGTFVCNHLMYGTLYTLAKSYPGVRGGFIHVPCIKNDAAAEGLSLAAIVKGVEAAIAAIGENTPDK